MTPGNSEIFYFWNSQTGRFWSEREALFFFFVILKQFNDGRDQQATFQRGSKTTIPYHTISYHTMKGGGNNNVENKLYYFFVYIPRPPTFFFVVPLELACMRKLKRSGLDH